MKALYKRRLLKLAKHLESGKLYFAALWPLWQPCSRQFFGIDDPVAWKHLFQPEAQITGLFGGRELSRNATPRQVASNIRAFVKIKEGK